MDGNAFWNVVELGSERGADSDVQDYYILGWPLEPLEPLKSLQMQGRSSNFKVMFAHSMANFGPKNGQTEKRKGNKENGGIQKQKSFILQLPNDNAYHFSPLSNRAKTKMNNSFATS